MDVGLVFSGKDPRQIEARDYLLKFIKEHGILAQYNEIERPVKSPTLIVDGFALRDLRSKPRNNNPVMFPNKEDMVKVLEKISWGL